MSALWFGPGLGRILNVLARVMAGLVQRGIVFQRGHDGINGAALGGVGRRMVGSGFIL